MAQKKTAAQRKKENEGVKGGTIRTGAKGKTVRKYNANTGRWDVIQKNTSGTGYGKTTPSYLPTATKPKSDTSTSGATGTYTKSYAKPKATSGATGTYTSSYAAKKKPTMAQPETPKAKLQQLQRALNAQMSRKRGIEAKKRKSAAEAAELKKINAEISRIRKALGS